MELKSDRKVVETLWALAWPTVATYAAFSVRQFTDTWMVGQLGTAPLAALLPAQQLLFLIQSFAFGLFSALNTCASHAHGGEDRREAAAYTWQCIWLAGFIGILGALLTFGTIPIFQVLNHEFAVYEQEVAYFRVAVFALLPQFIAVAVSNFFFAARMPFPPMWMGVGHVILNVIFNYLFMFGIPGRLEGMGIAGAAWGTVVASSFWAVGLLGIFLWLPGLSGHFTRHPVFSFERMRNLLKIGVPNGAIDVIDVLFWNVALVILIASFGTEHMAAASVLFTLWLLILVPCDGLGVALTTLVGHHLGAKQEAEAMRFLRACLVLSLSIAGLAAVLCLSFREWIFGTISENNLVIQIGSQCMVLFCICLILDACLYVVDSALNGAGDAVWPLKWGLLCNLIFILGGGVFMMRYFPGLTSYGIWICLALNRGAMALLFYLRWRSGAWRQMAPLG